MIIGIGIDIVDISRIEKTLERSNDKFFSRVYTDAERSYCSRKAKSIQHFAARFAAKEAVFKALGTGWSKGIGWKDVEILNDTNGTPFVKLSGKAKVIFDEKGGGKILVSISHTDKSAIAQAIWFRNEYTNK